MDQKKWAPNMDPPSIVIPLVIGQSKKASNLWKAHMGANELVPVCGVLKDSLIMRATLGLFSLAHFGIMCISAIGCAYTPTRQFSSNYPLQNPQNKRCP